MPRIRKSARAASRRGDPEPPQDNFENLTTEVLRLRCDNLQLPATGSRQALITRLHAAPRSAVNVQTGPNVSSSLASTDSAPSRPADQDSTLQGGFTAEQLETLQSLICSSIRDAIWPQPFSVPTSPEPTVSPGNSSSLPQHLPPKIIASICNGDYIDFNSLLSENVDGHDEHLKISFDSLGNSGISIPVSLTQQKRQRIDSIERWLTAFNTFASVVVHFSPNKVSELFAYQQSIRDAQRKFSGMAWYAYDITFRKKTSNDISISWAHRDPQLYVEKFIGIGKTACHVCVSADHFVNACPIAPTRSTPRPVDDHCRNYNRNVPCASNPCPFKHRCNRPGCVGRHPATVHDARAAGSRYSKRER